MPSCTRRHPVAGFAPRHRDRRLQRDFTVVRSRVRLTFRVVLIEITTRRLVAWRKFDARVGAFCAGWNASRSRVATRSGFGWRQVNAVEHVRSVVGVSLVPEMQVLRELAHRRVVGGVAGMHLPDSARSSSLDQVPHQ